MVALKKFFELIVLSADIKCEIYICSLNLTIALMSSQGFPFLPVNVLDSLLAGQGSRVALIRNLPRFPHPRERAEGDGGGGNGEGGFNQIPGGPQFLNDLLSNLVGFPVGNTHFQVVDGAGPSVSKNGLELLNF